MDINNIYRKTRIGTEEMALYKLVMKPVVRRTPIMVDGMRTVETMLPMFRDPQDAESVLKATVSLGLIEQISAPLEESQANSISADRPIENRLENLHPERDSAQRFMDGQKFINNAIRGHLGFKAIFLNLKLKNAGMWMIVWHFLMILRKASPRPRKTQTAPNNYAIKRSRF